MNISKIDSYTRKTKKRKIKVFTERTTPYILLTPAVLFVLLVVIYPIIKTVYYSLTNYMLWRPKDIQFVGFQNYFKLLKDVDFTNSLINTIKWVVIILTFQFLFGLILALILNQKFRGREILRATILLPWVTPSILTALMWVWMYNGNYGVLNFLLLKIGLINEYIPWLAKSSTALYSCMMTLIWQGTPFFTIMLIAGLSSIPHDLYEAGVVDGTSSLQAFIHITLPLLKDTIFITALLRTIWIANNVDMIYIMTSGGPANSSLTLSVNTFITAQRGFNFGYASSMSVYLTIILTIIAIFYVKKMNMSGVK